MSSRSPTGFIMRRRPFPRGAGASPSSSTARATSRPARFTMSASCLNVQSRFVRVLLALLLAGSLLSCGQKPPAAPPQAAASKLVVRIFAMPAHGLAIALRTPAGHTVLIDTGGKAEGYDPRSEEHTSELQSRFGISYA